MGSKTSVYAILAIVICTIFTSVGQLFWKWGVGVFQFNLMALLLNWQLILGFLLYGVGGIIMIISFKYGELSVLYPVLSMSYIWIAILSLYFLNEIISVTNWLGIVVIIGGISLMGWGESQ